MFNSQCSSVDDDLSELKGNTKDLSTSSSSLNESTVLNMRNRKLSDEQIEQEMGVVVDPKSILRVDLTGNTMTTIPVQNLKRFKSLKSLVLDQNDLSKSLAEEASDDSDDEGDDQSPLSKKQKKLVEKRLEEAFSKDLLSVEDISLKFNSMDNLPKFLKSCSKLNTLDLSFNKITLEERQLGRMKKFISSINAFRKKINLNKDDESSEDIPLPMSLTSLNLSNNYLKSFPVVLLGLDKLSRVVLNNNIIPVETIPVDIVTSPISKTITILELKNCKMEAFPKLILELTNLTVLVLSENPLGGALPIHNAPSSPTTSKNRTKLKNEFAVENVPGIPSAIVKLKHLKELYVSSCNLDLDDVLNIIRLHNIRKLIASKNRIFGAALFNESLSERIGADITVRTIPNAPLSSSVTGLRRNSKMQILDLAENQIKEFSSHMFPDLQELDLSKNYLSKIDEELGIFSPSISVLNLSSNKLDHIPSTIANMEKLQTLNLNKNQISSIDNVDFSKLTQLTELRVGWNLLTSLPDNIHPSELTLLHCNNNKLTCLPSNITAMCELIEVDATFNFISTIPNDVTTMKNLVRLDLSFNEITSVPEALLSLEMLQYIGIEQNSPALEEQQNLAQNTTIQILRSFVKPDEIIPGLFLGCEKSASNKEYLKSIGVSHILTVANEVTPRFINEDIFTSKYIPVKEARNSTIRPLFDEVFKFIDEGIKSTGIIIHCHVGVNRSASLVIAYLMKTRNLTYDESFKLVKSKRSCIAPMNAFVKQLLEYETELNRKATKL